MWINSKSIILFFRPSDVLAMTKLFGPLHSVIRNPVKQGYNASIAFLFNLTFNLKPHFVIINDWKPARLIQNIECISRTFL